MWDKRAHKPIKDIQRERGTSLEHIMVGTEYGMAREMTHGPVARPALPAEEPSAAGTGRNEVAGERQNEGAGKEGRVG